MQGKVETVFGAPNAYSFPRFSPDGKRIAVSIGSASSIDIWVYDIASKTPTKVTNEGARNDRVEWTRDGKRLVYSSVGRHGLTAIWMQNMDLSGDPQLLEGKKGEQVLEGQVSPDGTSLLFRSTATGHLHDIWYRSLAGDTTRKAFVSAPSTEYAPRFSPDGKWVAYTSNRDGTGQVYVQAFPSAGPYVKVTDAGGSTPVWSPDGHRIYYLNGGKIFAATVRMTPKFEVLSRDLVFAAQGYNMSSPVHAPFDVAPDGKHLLLLRPISEHNALVVVHDFKSELLKRARGAGAR